MQKSVSEVKFIKYYLWVFWFRLQYAASKIIRVI